MVELSHNQEKKDKKEWAIINMFRSSYPYFPIGELEKSESPDFLLHSGGKLIGIELTELKYEREDKLFNLRAHEDFLTYMMEDAQRIVEEKCDYKLMVEVLFSDDISPTVLMVNDFPFLIRLPFQFVFLSPPVHRPLFLTECLQCANPHALFFPFP